LLAIIVLQAMHSSIDQSSALPDFPARVEIKIWRREDLVVVFRGADARYDPPGNIAG
jgi:hypothetical protein